MQVYYLFNNYTPITFFNSNGGAHIAIATYFMVSSTLTINFFFRMIFLSDDVKHRFICCCFFYHGLWSASRITALWYYLTYQ